MSEPAKLTRSRWWVNLWLHYWGTTVHKFWVARNLWSVALRLLWRSLVHDLSKYRWSEARHFVEVAHLLKDSTYGTPEYRATLERIRPAITLHSQRNSHHPEHYPDGIASMSGLDEIEMVCDWLAATWRHKDGDIWRSILVNATRFKYGDERRHLYAKLVKDLLRER